VDAVTDVAEDGPSKYARTDRTHCRVCGGSFPLGFRACPYDASPLIIGADPLIGTVVAEHYRIESVLGEGGIGRVYLAQHTRISRRYAIKVPSGKAAADRTARGRFLREAEAASRIDHPNVVSVIDFGETPAGLLYIVMEYSEGETLGDRLARVGRLPLRNALTTTREIACGLRHAHDRGLIHRDLKPDNVILEKSEDRARILDFGLALLADLGDEQRVTTRGMVVGTPYYMSPEHACGMDVDARTDLFSLGVILYELLAGCMPFDGTPLDVLQRYVHDVPPAFAVRVPGLVVDAEVEVLCRQLLAKHRDKRPASAADVIATIDTISDRLAAERAYKSRR
jgi:eukaryotic-like serine/threonine-protein kinase